MKRSNSIPLIIEPYPEDYSGYQFITLIRYNDQNLLNIIDNIHNKQISTYVLDFCGPAQLNEDSIIDIAAQWYNSGKNIEYPISVEFSKRGLSAEMCKILRIFPIDYISRIIGPLPEYKMSGSIKVRKRKRKPIPKNIEFIDRRSVRT